MAKHVQERRTVNIANNASLSGEVDLTEKTLVGIIMPASWTAAVLTFAAASASGGTFVPVYDAAGIELTVQASTSRMIAIAPDALRGARFVKVRSGTSGAAVTQGGSRDLVFVVERLAEA